MERRTLLLIASTLVAALGTALVWLYVQGADARAGAEKALVRAYVVGAPHPAGSAAATVQADLATKSFTRESLADLDLVTDPGQIQGLRATQQLTPGLPLLRSQFGAGAVPPPAPVDLAPNKLAMQVQLGDPQRVAGLLQPGSRVVVFAETGGQALALLDQVRVLAADGAASTPAGGAATGAAAAGAASGGAAGGGAAGGAAGSREALPRTSVTLEVTQDQAKRLVLAQSPSSKITNIWFALRGDKARVDTGADNGVSTGQLLTTPRAGTP
jgi:pilus assembly protein CpaB